LGAREQLARRRVLDDLPEIHDGDPVAQELDRREVVVMKRHENPRSRWRSRSRLRIAACTDTSRAETGSSAIRSDGATDNAPREPDALPLAARKLVRVAVPELGTAGRTWSKSATTLVSSSRPLASRCSPQRLADDLAAGHARVQRRVRILEDHVHLAPKAAASPAARGV
jgi:hypothetical protein